MGDVEKDLGNKTVEGLSSKFPNGSIIFVHCDNTKDKEIESKYSF